MKIERRYTKGGQSPYAEIAFRVATSEIRNPDGSIVFRLENIDVPAQFSQVAADILAQKYFRKAGVPARLKPVEENTVPSWLWRQEADLAALEALPEEERYGSEIDARQVFDRLAGTWTYWGWKGGYFDSEADAQTFYDELRYMLATQKVAPNSPQWFNTGLHWAYGIDGPSQGHFYVDFQTGELTRSATAYEHPQPHACFIQSVQDDLVNENGIMDLWVREARLFKYGSGTGSNFSRVRGEGEKLSGGGKSSGLMSFLKIGDRAAGAIKSGGTTRRAAKMVVVDVDHPDIEDYITWKVREEQKVAALVTGSKICQKHLTAIMQHRIADCGDLREWLADTRLSGFVLGPGFGDLDIGNEQHKPHEWLIVEGEIQAGEKETLGKISPYYKSIAKFWKTTTRKVMAHDVDIPKEEMKKEIARRLKHTSDAEYEEALDFIGNIGKMLERLRYSAENKP